MESTRGPIDFEPFDGRTSKVISGETVSSPDMASSETDTDGSVVRGSGAAADADGDAEDAVPTTAEDSIGAATGLPRASHPAVMPTAAVAEAAVAKREIRRWETTRALTLDLERISVRDGSAEPHAALDTGSWSTLRFDRDARSALGIQGSIQERHPGEAP